MMIRPQAAELESAIAIALTTAPTDALSNTTSSHGALDRQVAIETLTCHVVAALQRYEITREPDPHDDEAGSLPLFPELRS